MNVTGKSADVAAWAWSLSAHEWADAAEEAHDFALLLVENRALETCPGLVQLPESQPSPGAPVRDFLAPMCPGEGLSLNVTITHGLSYGAHPNGSFDSSMPSGRIP